MDSKTVAEFAARTAIGPFGSRMKSDAYTESGVPVIRGTNLTGGKVLSGNWVYVSDKTADDLSNCCVFPGDLVFPHRGAIGEVGIVPDQFPRYVMSSSLMTLSCDRSKAHPDYVYYFFKSAAGRHELLKNSSQVGTPGIGQPLSTLRTIEVPLPSPSSQRLIAKILGDLDSKIDVNRHINQTLEAMAQTIFKSWFVDFTPVKAKIAAIQKGHDPLRAAMSAISGKLEAELDTLPHEQYAQLAATAELFPEEMMDSELGEIPRGWSVSPLSKMIQLIGGGTPKRSEPSYWGGDVLWYSVKDAPSDGDVWAVDTDEKITDFGLQKSSTKLIPFGATIISARGTVGKLAMVGKEMAMNQSCYGVTGVDGIGSCFNYLNLKEAVETLKRNTHGAVFDTITQTTFETVNCVRPLKEQLEAFEQQVLPLLAEIRTQVIQNRTLAVLRDTLLPKLLTGELPVTALVEAAGGA